MAEKLDKGKEGEDIAVAYLIKKGFHILKRNFTSKHSEIDIICEKDGVLVFCEVRSKINADYGHPEDTMGKAKKNAILRGAEVYLFQHPYVGEARFDFISIIFKPKFELIHFEDAFY